MHKSRKLADNYKIVYFIFTIKTEHANKFTLTTINIFEKQNNQITIVSY